MLNSTSAFILKAMIFIVLLVLDSYTGACKIENESVILIIDNKKYKIDQVEIGKHLVNWVDLKTCYFFLDEELKKNENSDKEYIKLATEKITKALVEYRNESKKFIDKFLISLFCEPTHSNILAKQWPEISADEEKYQDIPFIFRKIFPKGTRILKCHPEAQKILLVSVLGSEAVTSDYDFSLFIYDKSEIKAIEDKLNNNKSDKVNLTIDNLIIPDNKEIYINFATTMILNLFEAAILVKNIYKEFEAKIKEDYSVKFKGKTQVDYGSMPCKALNTCYDSNAYPDKMAMHTLVFKPPMIIISSNFNTLINISDNRPNTFDKNDIALLEREYLKFSVDSICEYSQISAMETEEDTLMNHINESINSCSAKLRKSDFEHDNPVNKEIHFKKESKDDGEKSFHSCLIRNCKIFKENIANPKVNLDNFQQSVNFESIFQLDHAMAICSIYLDEGYYTIGALEHFSFSGNKAITIQNFSLAESFKENFAMLLIHYAEKMKTTKEIKSRNFSDPYSKYLSRGFSALYLMFHNLAIPKGNQETYMFDYRNLKDFIEINETLQNTIFDEYNFKPDEKKAKLENELGIDAYKMAEFSHFESCLDNLLYYFKQLALMKKTEKSDPKSNQYTTDDQKKELMFNHFVDFVTGKHNKKCHGFDTPQNLFLFTVFAKKVIEEYLYFSIYHHMINFNRTIETKNQIISDDIEAFLQDLTPKTEITSNKEYENKRMPDNFNRNDIEQTLTNFIKESNESDSKVQLRDEYAKFKENAKNITELFGVRNSAKKILV